MMNSKNKKILLILFILVLFIGFIARVIPLRTAFWWDETVYLQNADTIAGVSDNYNELGFRPPLLSLIIAGANLLTNSILIISVIMALLGLIAPIFAYLIGKELYSMEVGFVSGSLMAILPFFILNSRFIMTGIPSLGLICISLYFLIKAKNKWLYFLSGIFLSLSVLMRFTSLIFCIIILLYFIIKKINIKYLLYVIYGSLISMLPYLIWAQITQGFFLLPFIRAQFMVGDRNTSLFFYFTEFIKVFSYITLLGIIGWLTSIIRFKKHKYKKLFRIKDKDLFFLGWALLFLFYMTFIVKHKELRYILPIGLPVIILSSIGLLFLIKHKNKVIRSISLVAILIITIVSIYPSFNNIDLDGGLVNNYQTEEMKLSYYLKENFDSNTIIYTNQNYPVFAYYSGLKTIFISYGDSFYDNYPLNMNSSGLFICYKNIDKNPTPEWLNNNHNFDLIKETENILVYYYDSNN